MSQFSKIEINLDKIKNSQNRLKAFSEISFTDAENKPAVKDKRLKKVTEDYRYFDRVYFTNDMYSDGYFEPCELHTYIENVVNSNGVKIVLAPREHGKTVEAKKILIWKLLTGQVDIAGVYCETLPKASNILNDLSELISLNQRIMSDFNVQIIENNDDQLRFSTSQNRGIKTVGSFSQGRSLRGYTKSFGRAKFLLVDDLETLESSMNDDAVRMRIDKLSEAYQSMSSKQRTILVLGNDFDRRGALHRLRLEQEEGILNKQWHVKVFKAWSDGEPLWKSKFPNVKSETELKNLIGVVSESDWQGNFQQNPVPPDGLTFKREHYQSIKQCPKDARGVIYCDPNLSIKGKGDTTAIVSYKYSPIEDIYIIDKVRCKSYSDSNMLLDDLFEMKNHTHVAIYMDGNVSQESNWTNNLRNYSRQKGHAVPRIIFARYNVDLIAKNAALLWSQNKIYFTEDVINTKEGKIFIEQMFAFGGKKNSKVKDDAPDAVICANEAIAERYLNRSRTVMGKSYIDRGFRNNVGLD